MADKKKSKEEEGLKDEVKKELTDKCVELRKLVNELEDLAKKAKDLGAVIKEKNVKLVATFELYGLTQMKLKDIGTFYLEDGIFPKLLDEEKFIAYLEKDDLYETFYKRTLNTNTFKAFVREKIKNGEEVPDGTDSYTETKVKMRRK